MIANGLRPLLLGLIVGCQPARGAAPSLTVTPEPPIAKMRAAQPPAEAVAPAPKLDIVVRNMGPRECKVAVSAGIDATGPDEAPSILPVGATTIAMAKTEGLAIQNAEGKYSIWASTDGDPDVIVVYGGCRSIAAAASFTPARLATMAPHIVASCCGACNEQGCTACTEVNPGARCKGKQAIAGKCALFDDVLDCVPATAVEADGIVTSEYAFRRMSAAGAAK